MVEAAFRTALRAAKAFAGTFRSDRQARRQAPPSAHFGEIEQLEEAKFYPPPPSPRLPSEEGKLPDSYGQTRLVLLVVDPQLVHAYWSVTPDVLRAAKRRTGEPSQAILRFYEDGRNFDVGVDLEARNWYVSLWSPNKSCHADLGLMSEAGAFVPLARSNAIVTPRTLPTAAGGERFLRADPSGALTEISLPPPYRTPPRRLQKPVGLAPVVGAPASPREAALAEATNSSGVLARKLAEFIALRESSSEPLKAQEELVLESSGEGMEENHRTWEGDTSGSSWPELGFSDLTDLAEKQKAAGFSSEMLQDRNKKQ